MDIYTVKKLLDHAHVNVADKHYIELNIGKVRKEMDDIELEDLIDEHKYE